MERLKNFGALVLLCALAGVGLLVAGAVLLWSWRTLAGE